MSKPEARFATKKWWRGLSDPPVAQDSLSRQQARIHVWFLAAIFDALTESAGLHLSTPSAPMFLPAVVVFVWAVGLGF